MGAERGINCEHMQAMVTNIPETLEVAGRPTDGLAARILQKQYGRHGKLGREDGIRRGQSVVPKIPTLTEVHGCGAAAFAGGDAGRSWLGLL